MMKKITILVMLVIGSLLLTSCEKINVEPGIINVVFENPRYEGTSFFIDAYITNGLDEDMYIGDVDFALYPQGIETEIAAAGFQINETVKAGKYFLVELEFYEEYVFISKTEFEAAQYDLKNIELQFWIYK